MAATSFSVAGGAADVIRASVARPEQVRRMFDEIADRYGRLDILVNSAADGHFVTGEYEPGILDKAFDTNVKGSLACAQAARPLMAAAGGLSGPVAWIMGNEAWGLPEEDARLADEVVAVPMWGQAESLNLSSAAAVCLYATASAQRRTGEGGPAHVRAQ